MTTIGKSGTLTGIGLAFALALVVSLGTSAGPAQAQADDELAIETAAWCPPQLEGCLEPAEPCAGYAAPDRWMGLDVRVLDADDEPVEFANTTLAYTDLSGEEPVDREKTTLTDEDGIAGFSLREAENVTLEAEHDGRTGETTLSPTWGTIDVELPPTGNATLGAGHTLTADYTVTGVGPAGSPPGSINLAQHETPLRVGLEATDGTASDEIVGLATGTAHYQVTSAAICGLPLTAKPTTQVDWHEPELRLHPDPLQVAVEEDPIPLAPTGIDHEGEVFPLDAHRDLTWSIEPTSAADVVAGHLVPGANATEATLVGTLVRGDGIDATTEIEITAGNPATLSLDCPSTFTGGTIGTCRIDAIDELGNPASTENATWTVDGPEEADNAFVKQDKDPELRYLAPLEGGEVTLTARLGDLTKTTNVTVTDEGAPTIQAGGADSVAIGQLFEVPVQAFDPSGVSELRLEEGGRTLDRRPLDGSPEVNATLNTSFSTSRHHPVSVIAEDTNGNVRETLLTVDVTDPSSGRAGGGSSTTSSSTASSSSGSPSSEEAAGSEPDGPPEDRSPGPVRAEPTGDRQTAQLTLQNGTTPVVETTDADLSARITTASHDELVVELRGEAARPAPIPGLELRTVDVTPRTTQGLHATIDEARLTITVDEATLDGLDAEPRDLQLLHWTADRWQVVDAEARTTEEAVELIGTVTSLSPFAVTLPDEGDAGTVTELEPTAGSDELPLTYRGSVDVPRAGHSLTARTSDGAVALSTRLGHAGEHRIELMVTANPGEGQPGAVTDEGRYLEATIVGPDGTIAGLGDEASLTLDTDALPGEASEIVPAAVDQGAWRPLDATVTYSREELTVATHASPAPLMALLVDDEAPRVGLEDPLNATLVGETAIQAVAGDNLGVERVRLVADGAVLAVAEERPFALTLDGSNLDEGTTELRIEAVDAAGNVGETTRTVEIREDEDLDEAETDPPTGAEPGDEGQRVPGIGLAVALVTLAAVARGHARRP